MPERPRILIIDDDPVVSGALAQRLAEWGHASATAPDAEQALAMLERSAQRAAERFGVVISDLDLPRQQGLDLVKHLKQHHGDIVTILTTEFGKVETAVQAMRLGAVDYLMKPLIEEELRDAVDRAAQKHALLTDERTAQLQQTPVPSPEAQPAGAGDWAPMPLSEALKEPERRILLAALEANGWNRQATARQLDINRTTLYKKIKQYRLDEPG